MRKKSPQLKILRVVARTSSPTTFGTKVLDSYYIGKLKNRFRIFSLRLLTCATCLEAAKWPAHPGKFTSCEAIWHHETWKLLAVSSSKLPAVNLWNEISQVCFIRPSIGNEDAPQGSTQRPNIFKRRPSMPGMCDWRSRRLHPFDQQPSILVVFRSRQKKIDMPKPCETIT